MWSIGDSDALGGEWCGDAALLLTLVVHATD